MQDIGVAGMVRTALFIERATGLEVLNIGRAPNDYLAKEDCVMELAATRCSTASRCAAGGSGSVPVVSMKAIGRRGFQSWRWPGRLDRGSPVYLGTGTQRDHIAKGAAAPHRIRFRS
jgi:hypothetical protein